jgi:hypothetical protein
MTGAWNHESPAGAGLYALDLLFGKKGFLLFALPLVQTLAGSYWLLRHRYAERSAVIALGAWAIATWLLYAATSRNLSGFCLSVRWFVPLLAPGYAALMILVRDYPRTRRPAAILLACSALLATELVARGTWSARVPKLLWPTVALGTSLWMIAWVAEFRRWRRVMRATNPHTPEPPGPSRAATTA